MEPIHPNDGNSVGTVNLGLMQQFHYVALIPTESVNREGNATEIARYEAAFEHTCKVKGTPFETCLIPENPELEGKVFSLAPGEGQNPLVILADPKFEKMCNPDKYPCGKGGYLTKRAHHITTCKYFNQRILDVDGRFVKDIEYLFVAQYTVEAKQIKDDASNFILCQRHGIQGT